MSAAFTPTIVPAGDAALLVTLGEEISLGINSRVRALAAAVERQHVPGIKEAVVAYATLLVHYDPLTLSYDTARETVQRLLQQEGGETDEESRLLEIPTVFGGSYGPDLPFVARSHEMSPEEYLRRFQEITFTVYMLGFAPGNPYLGGLPNEMAMPRLESPRERVPAGTVAVANQAAIYSLPSPGGWHWLGRTYVQMFDPAAAPPCYLRAGDRVRFVPIPEETYLRMGGKKAE